MQLKLFVLILLSGSLVSAAPISKGQSPKLKFAVALNETGASTSTSNPTERHIRNGISLALRLNKHSPQLNSVLWVNHKETAEGTLEAIKTINRVKPSVVIGMGNSFQALLSAEHMDRSILLLSPVATSDEILKKSSNILLMSNPNSVQGELLVNEISKISQKSDKILLLEIIGCPYCTDLKQAMVQSFAKRGIEPTIAKVHFTEISKMAIGAIQKVGFQQIVVPAHEAEAARLIQVLFPKNQNAIYWGADGWGNGRFVAQLPFAGKLKSFWLSHYHPDIKTPINLKFVTMYRSAYDSDPVDTSAFYFETAQLVLSWTDDFPKKSLVKIFTESGQMNGITGRILFKDRHVIRSMPILSLENGKVIFKRMVEPGV